MARKPDIEYYKLNDEKRKIVEDNYGFIIFIANKIYKRIGCYIEMDDLIQMCAETFIKCLKKYDPNKGKKITAYASQRIISEVYDYINMIANIQKRKEYSLGLQFEDFGDDKIINNIENYVVNKVYIENILKEFSIYYGNKACNAIKMILFNQMRQSEVARELGLSRERIRQYVGYFKEFYNKQIA